MITQLKKSTQSHFLIFIGILFSLSTHGQAKKIVFVCEHGSAKSVIAAAYFNKLAKEKNLAWEAVSRGISPDAEVSARTKQLLKSDHLFDDRIIPRRLTQDDVDGAGQVFLFHPLPENIQGKNNIHHWLEVKSVNDDFRELRNEIVARIVPLVDSLANQ
jgi:arsenate reductase